MSDNQDIGKLLRQCPGLSYDSKNGRVVCSYNGHEMPNKLEAVESFIKGKKYQKLRDKHTSQLLEEYKEHIVPSIKKATKTQLFCKLTLRHLNNLPHHIERHVNGKRFKRALARWKLCKEQGAVFVPRAGQERKQKVSETDSLDSSNSMMGRMHIDSSEDQQPFDDDLDDLYPPEDFNSGESDEGSDFDMENMATKVPVNTSQPEGVSKTGEKRKAKEESSAVNVVKRAKLSASEKTKTKKHKDKNKLKNVKST